MDVHISVIEDFKTACPHVEVVDWCMSGHAWVMKRNQDKPLHIHANTWRGLNREMIQAFQQEYDRFLKTFDFFIVGYASCFVLIYEKYEKPILMMNAVRYDVPFCWNRDTNMLRQYEECLRRLSSQKRLTVVSNNQADADILKQKTDIPSLRLPSLCLYPQVTYVPANQTRFLAYTSDKLVSHPFIAPRTTFEYSDLVKYKGIIHFPYEISTMSIYEHYSMGIPLFFPTKRFLRELWQTNQVPFTSVSSYWNPPIDSVDMSFWLDRADFYDSENLKHVYYFDSLSDLYTQLESFTDTLYEQRQEWIRTRKATCLNVWKQLYPTYQ